MKEHQFIAIGDTVIDEFIRLDESSRATLSGEPDTKDYKLCIPFADKIPYTEAYFLPAVGNAANGAVAAARLGLETALVTNLGDDANGRECLAALEANKVDVDFVKTHKDKKTNYHYALWYGDDRTILIKHENYEYSLPDIKTPKWLYFSSVNQTAYPFHNVVADYLETHPEIRLAFQPGKWEIKLGKEKLSRLYDKADIFFCNVEEAGAILGVETLGVKELLRRLWEVGPKIVVITDGSRGAHAYNGTTMWTVPVYPDIAPPVERTGAGDAFASTTVVALSMGKDLPTALTWGAVNSMSVVQHVGAQQGLLSKEKIEEYLAKAPSDFKPTELD
ncbi:MAG: carbohydrate kinase PfkB, ribokinase [Parcubacteria group bacterium]|nr:carbohydrate kinase PfkB, ribokinase [Parcubacteria group bacterium]